MSLLNFYQFDDDTAAVAVDTLDSRGSESAKMLVLPHLGAVIAGRGRAAVSKGIAARVMQFASFDQAANELERELVEVHDALPAHDEAAAASLGMSVASLYEREFGTDGSDVRYLGAECLLVGLSARTGHIEATYIKRARPGASAEVLKRAGLVVSPPEDELIKAAPLMLATDTGAYLLASLQLERCAETKRPGYGGRLLVARMKRGEVTVRDVGRLERQAHATQAQRAS
ncbi:hypothetical protein [Piscinibacter defluvii]|uniref:hypothetical protein n=1 Tax=Piscinibacter defluvii TaxID=1796922 RepID=UPI000FDE84CF|nr:hypothetical protein [Piscinibacter defluvii]